MPPDYYAKYNMLGETEKSSDVCRTASLSEMGHERRAATSSTVTDQRWKNFFHKRTIYRHYAYVFVTYLKIQAKTIQIRYDVDNEQSLSAAHSQSWRLYIYALTAIYTPTESTSQREQALWQYLTMKSLFDIHCPVSAQYVHIMSSPYAFEQSTHIHTRSNGTLSPILGKPLFKCSTITNAPEFEYNFHSYT